MTCQSGGMSRTERCSKPDPPEQSGPFKCSRQLRWGDSRLDILSRRRHQRRWPDGFGTRLTLLIGAGAELPAPAVGSPQFVARKLHFLQRKQ